MHSYSKMTKEQQHAYDMLEDYFSQNFPFQEVKEFGIAYGKANGLDDEDILSAWNERGEQPEKESNELEAKGAVQIICFAAQGEDSPIMRFISDGGNQEFEDFEISQPLFDAFQATKGCDFWTK